MSKHEHGRETKKQTNNKKRERITHYEGGREDRKTRGREIERKEMKAWERVNVLEKDYGRERREKKGEQKYVFFYRFIMTLFLVRQNCVVLIRHSHVH